MRRAGCALDAAAQRGRRVEQRSRVGEQLGAGRGQRDGARVALEQRGAELALERADRPAQGRLGDVQLLGRAPEVQVLGDSDEVAELSQIDVDAPKVSIHPDRSWTGPSGGSTMPP
ncbi:MAG TPA: hypothetical protein VGF46_13320 [Gaiellales bacterium]